MPMSTQWNNLLLHLGVWDGSFTRLSPRGDMVEETLTRVMLEGLDENRTIRQTIQRFSATPGEEMQAKVLEYSTLNRSTLFFENGSFSQGSIQYGPFSEFGAEMGFIQGDRRMRLVILYGTDGHLSRVTLIREHRQETDASERPPLTLDQLLGEWCGEAKTLYADLRTPIDAPTTLTLSQQGDRLQQRMTSAGFDFSSTATIDGSTLRFETDTATNQVVLLPDGASYTAPLSIPKGRPFRLEAGWMLEGDRRQRLIRSYDANGTWVSLTLVTEQRIA
ncbi:MAG: DUF3598 family protein [Elainellaceae cyanobacterium]